jgi:hypothetical protein
MRTVLKIPLSKKINKFYDSKVSDFIAITNDVECVPIGNFENSFNFPSDETSLGRGGFAHNALQSVPCPLSPSRSFLSHKTANTQ